MAESIIVGADGKPLRKEDLTRELAAPSLTGIRQVWNAESIASGLNPQRLASLLMSAATGDARGYLTLAEEMEERELHYASVLGTRKRAISGLEPIVESASDEARDLEIADAVEELARAPYFGDLIDDMLDAIGKGYSVNEILWDRSESQWQPEGYIWRDPRFFTFDRNDGRTVRLLDESDAFQGIPLAPYKFIVHKPRLKSGLPIRGGLARLVSVAYMCKAYGITDWVAFAEIFGMPLRIGRYGNNASASDIQTLINAVANLGTDAAAVLPESMKIEFQEAGNQAGAGEIFERLATFFDKQTSKAVLGQTMTADDGSSKSQAQVHNEVRGDIQIADARQTQNTLNRDLVRAFVDLNFGPQKAYPRIVLPVPQPEDLKTLAEVLEIMVPIGMEVEESWARDKFGVPAAAKGAKLLGTAKPMPSGNTETATNRERRACPNCGTARNRQEPDQLDALVDEGTSDWQPQLAPILDPVRALAEQCETYDEFLAALPALLKQMDSSELVKRLAISAFKARGLGDAGA